MPVYESNVEAVLVTGAAGFIGSHIVKELLEHGYHVRGTVRDLQDHHKIKHLLELQPSHRLQLVEAELTDTEGWIPAVKDCHYVIHVASPIPVAPTTCEDELVIPAVQGTLNVLKACQSVSTVKRVVLTSSSCAVWSEVDKHPKDKVFDESDWPDSSLPGTSVYSKSKILAEKAAWNFVNNLPPSERFELTVLNPTMVMGPVLHSTQCVSMQMHKSLLEGKLPLVPRIKISFIDVRDAATAHVAALTDPRAAGQRHIITAHQMWMHDIAGLLKNRYSSQGYKISTTVAPYCFMWLYSRFDKFIRGYVLPLIGKEFRISSQRMQEVLGMHGCRSAEESILDMAESMIKKGAIEKPCCQ